MEQQDPDAAGRVPADRLSNPTEQYSSLEHAASFSQSSGHQHHASAHRPAHDTAARNGPAELAAEQFYKTYQPTANDTNGSPSSTTSLPLPKETISNGAAPATRHIGLLSTRHPRPPPPRSMSGSSAPSAVRLPSGPVSVKDLKKRFDQRDETIPPPRPNYRTAGAPSTNNAESANLRSRHTSTATRPRTSGASEKSFASRIRSSSRTENSDSLSRQQSNSSATSATSGGLLFGEILPDQNDSLTAGHGIEVVRPRRASEAGVHELAGPAFRYDDGPEPAVSSSWYRDADMTQQNHVHELRNATPRKQKGRSQSDAAPADSATSNATNLNNRSTTAPTATVSPTSKLPIPVRRLPPLSTVDHNFSPYNASLTSAQSSQPSSISSSRSSPNSSRTRIPPGSSVLSAQAARERQPQGSDISSRNTRSRQAGAAASTASSRMRERESARSRAPGSSGSSRRRLVSIGPEDFEQRREHIRLAYTKSIRESQVIEAQKLEELRRREQEFQALPAAELPASRSSELKPAERSTARDSMQSNSSQRSTGKLLKRRSRANSERKGIMEGLASTLNISTAMGSSQRVSLTSKGPFAQELPGSVPVPQPAELENHTPSSATSVVTEFDVEPQEGMEEQEIAQERVQEQEQPVPITAVRPPSPPQPDLPAERQTLHDVAPFQREIEATFTKRHEHKTSDATIAPTAQMKASLSGIFTDEFEESLSLNPPMPTLKSYETTVTILSDSNAKPSTSSRENAAGPSTASFRHSTAEESDCYSELDAGAGWQNAGRDSDGANTNSYVEDTDNRSRADETQYATDSQFDSRRASAYESSDMGAIFDEMTGSMYEQRLQESTALSLPPFTVRSDRFSRQSGWTEYTDTSGVADTSTRNSVQHGFDNNYTSTSSPQSVHFRQHRDSSMNDFSETDDASALSMPLGQITSHSSTHLPVPEHEPPPIPTSASENALDNFHHKEVITGQPDVADQEQVTTPIRDLDSKPLPPIVDEEAAKAKRKLGQRRNVIKELMDTEAIFVRDMNVIKEIYKGTAEACPKLDDQTVKLIFRNTDDIINFHSVFLADLTRAVAPVYMTKSSRKSMMLAAGTTDLNGLAKPQLSAELDRQVSIGPLFEQHLETMKTVHEIFLRNSDHAIKRLIEIQQEPSVQVWLAECNSVAKDLTAAWDLDSLLIKPMQRITKYPNLLITLLQHTPNDHPDQIPLMKAKDLVESAILEINKTKKNFELVGQIVGRKRRESDVKTGLARAFGKRVDKLQASNVRPIEDPEYEKLKERFGDDYLRLQVVLRDVEFYTRQVSEYCHEFLQYLSSIELVMRLQPGAYPELESKWVQFNISMRDLEKVVLEQHLAQVRKLVIEPFEQVIKAYGNPSLAMKKRLKRRPDWERGEQLRRGGKTLDSKLREQVEQYEALNEALKTELPKLSKLTEKIGNICLGNFVNIQAKWYQIWMEKMRTVAADSTGTPEIHEIMTAFQRDFPYAAEQVASIGMLDPAQRGRISQSTSTNADDPSFRHSTRSRTVDGRARGMSMNDDSTTNLHASQRHSGSVPMSPSASNSGAGGAAPSPHQYYYRDYYTPAAQGGSSASPKSTDASSGLRSTVGTGFSSTRPSTSRSAESGALPRQSVESGALPRQSVESGALPRQSVESTAKRDSSSAYVSGYSTTESNRFSNMFHSALPPDNINESGGSQIHEMGDNGDGYNVLWLAASLFEFNISTTKHEAGYPYLTYQAGEIFDVIAEKGELWLAKNQDDQTQQVGWIWSKHFARLADS